MALPLMLHTTPRSRWLTEPYITYYPIYKIGYCLMTIRTLEGIYTHCIKTSNGFEF